MRLAPISSANLVHIATFSAGWGLMSNWYSGNSYRRVLSHDWNLLNASNSDLACSAGFSPPFTWSRFRFFQSLNRKSVDDFANLPCGNDEATVTIGLVASKPYLASKISLDWIS